MQHSSHRWVLLAQNCAYLFYCAVFVKKKVFLNLKFYIWEHREILPGPYQVSKVETTTHDMLYWFNTYLTKSKKVKYRSYTTLLMRWTRTVDITEHPVRHTRHSWTALLGLTTAESLEAIVRSQADWEVVCVCVCVYIECNAVFCFASFFLFFFAFFSFWSNMCLWPVGFIQYLIKWNGL